MCLIPILLLSLYCLPTNSEPHSLHHFNLNAVVPAHDDDLNAIIPLDVDENNDDIELSTDLPYIKTGLHETEVEFEHPINSVNIGYSKNAILLKFRKQRQTLSAEDADRRKFLENNFMRFGRGSAQDFMRFGKRSQEEMPNGNLLDRNDLQKSPKGDQFERSSEIFDKGESMGLRDSRGDNFMRFGRDPGQDFMRFGRSPADFMRFGRDPNQNFMRFGRSSAQNFMRLRRNPGQDFMRFGRSPADFMRLGRDPNQNFMRFGRNHVQYSGTHNDPTGSKSTRGLDQNFIRFGRTDNFMRFGRSDSDSSSNFMRFGRSNPKLLKDEKNANHTHVPLLQKSDIKEAARILHEIEPDTEESNPVDKAIQVLFSKHSKEEDSGKTLDDDVVPEQDY